MPSRATTRARGGSAIRCGGSGSRRYGVEARMQICPGSASSASSIASFRRSRHYTRCPVTVSTPKPEGGARCVSSARRDLCGGRGEILVPTATVERIEIPRGAATCCCIHGGAIVWTKGPHFGRQRRGPFRTISGFAQTDPLPHCVNLEMEWVAPLTSPYAGSDNDSVAY